MSKPSETEQPEEKKTTKSGKEQFFENVHPEKVNKTFKTYKKNAPKTTIKVTTGHVTPRTDVTGVKIYDRPKNLNEKSTRSGKVIELQNKAKKANTQQVKGVDKLSPYTENTEHLRAMTTNSPFGEGGKNYNRARTMQILRKYEKGEEEKHSARQKERAGERYVSFKNTKNAGFVATPKWVEKNKKENPAPAVKYGDSYVINTGDNTKKKSIAENMGVDPSKIKTLQDIAHWNGAKDDKGKPIHTRKAKEGPASLNTVLEHGGKPLDKKAIKKESEANKAKQEEERKWNEFSTEQTRLENTIKETSGYKRLDYNKKHKEWEEMTKKQTKSQRKKNPLPEPKKRYVVPARKIADTAFKINKKKEGVFTTPDKLQPSKSNTSKGKVNIMETGNEKAKSNAIPTKKKGNNKNLPIIDQTNYIKQNIKREETRLKKEKKDKAKTVEKYNKAVENTKPKTTTKTKKEDYTDDDILKALGFNDKKKGGKNNG